MGGLVFCSSKILAFALLSTFLVAGCSSSQHRSSAAAVGTKGEESSDLTWTDAKARKDRLSRVGYTVAIDITGAAAKAETARYTGTSTIQFDLKDAKTDLSLNFFEGAVDEIRVNGNLIPVTAKKKYHIVLPAATLVVGANTVMVKFDQEYSKTGQGLHRFVDSADGKVYLYSQFETFDANKFMPCFDQPDLRSTMRLTVTAPKNWHVVSATTEAKKTAAGKSATTWEFKETTAISSYLFSLHAGPYAVMTDRYTRKDGTSVPLRLFVRPSLKKFVVQKDWFGFSKKGLAFYENYFAVQYPFGKLDQVIAPEFNMGGMENVGAIVYTEWAVPRSKPKHSQRRSTAELVLHEIAHMWFGDLVTMAWWNDLWLNESFATYMSNLAMAEATEFKEAWQDFGAGSKKYAYIEDAMPTTHPIEAQINTVKEAESNFDSITYEKGASVMKQLAFHMTETSFRSGMREYFKTYAYQNTTLSQYIGALQKHTDKDLSLWASRWLKQSGIDQLATKWTCEGETLNKIEVELKTLAGREFRPQSTEVGLYKTNGGAVKTLDHVRVDFTKSTELKQILKGSWACPDFVYPNHGDYNYTQVTLDPKSVEFLTMNLVKVEDTIVRTLVWNDLWRMVRDVELPLKTYIDIVHNNFPKEKNEIILQQVVGTLARQSGSVLGYWPRGSAEEIKDRTEFVAQMEETFTKRLKAAKTGSDDEKFWFDSLAQLAETPKTMDQFYHWYQAGHVSKGFSLDLDRRWNLVSKLVRYQHPFAMEALEDMKSRDTSDRGKKSALAVAMLPPNYDIKAKGVEKYVGWTIGKTKEAKPFPVADAKPDQIPLQEAVQVMRAMFPTEQSELRLKFSKLFYDYLETNRKSEDTLRVSTVVNHLLPLDCQGTLSTQLKDRVGRYSDLNPSLKKDILMSVDEDERCQRVRRNSQL